MRRGQARGQQVDPIARWEPGGDAEVLLMDPKAVQIHFGVSDRTVRRRCEPVACDVATRAPLYDQEDASTRLATVRARPGGTAAARRVNDGQRYRLAS